MYSWYAAAAICYAYLADVGPFQLPEQGRSCEIGSSIRESIWFSRGWTLQELIAPKEVHFYCRGWNFFGSRSKLLVLLSQITLIDISILNRSKPLSQMSVAKRMSWAANRKTTRVEDIAYCLLGIFNINIPMLYGEGNKSFIRLQEEIIRTNVDLSIFAWGVHRSSESSVLLAESPNDFVGCHDIVSWGKPGQFELTNRSLRIDTRLKIGGPRDFQPPNQSRSSQEFLMLLHCRFEEDLTDSLALILQQETPQDIYHISTKKATQKEMLMGTNLGSNRRIGRLVLVKMTTCTYQQRSIHTASSQGSLEIARYHATSKRPAIFSFHCSSDLPIRILRRWPVDMWARNKGVMRADLNIHHTNDALSNLNKVFPTSHRLEDCSHRRLVKPNASQPRGAVQICIDDSTLPLTIVFGFDRVIQRPPLQIVAPLVDIFPTTNTVSTFSAPVPTDFDSLAASCALLTNVRTIFVLVPIH